MNREILITVFFVFLFILSGCSKDKVIFDNSNQTITDEEIDEYIKGKYYEQAIEDLINAKLLEAKSVDKNIKFEYEGKKINPSDKDFLLKAKPIIITLLKGNIDDKLLETYFKENRSDFSNNVINVDFVKVEHSQVQEFMKFFNDGKSVEQILSLLKLDERSLINMDVDEENEIYSQLDPLEKGDLTMIMDGSKHGIAIVREKRHEEMFWPKNKEAILETYISKNFGDEYLKLLSNLNKEYKVTRKLK